MRQVVRFAETPAGRVAYSVMGSGPPLVGVLGWVSHLGLMWEHREHRQFVEALAREHTVILYDKLGCGLSDRARTDFHHGVRTGQPEGVGGAPRAQAVRVVRLVRERAGGGGVCGDPSGHAVVVDRAWQLCPRPRQVLLDEFTAYGTAAAVQEQLARWDATVDITMVGIPPGLPWPRIEATVRAAAPSASR